MIPTSAGKLLPLLWLIAPRLSALLRVALVSGWQLPAVSLGVLVQFLLPFFIAVPGAEMIGAEVSQGTLAPLLLRPVDRTHVIVSKLIVARLYPALLIAVLVAGSLLAGLGSFTGGTGLGPGFFGGVGPLGGGEAFFQVLRGSALAAVILMPVAALSLLFGVLYLNTAGAALATLAGLNSLRRLVVFQEGVQRLLLTSHFDLYARQENILQPSILLLSYTAGFGLMAAYASDRRDV